MLRFLALAGAVAAALLVLPTAAQAGTYTVRSCLAADGSTTLPADGWRAEGGAQFSNPVNACPDRGGLFAHLNGEFDHPTNSTAITWHFAAPADTRIAAYKLWRSAFAEPTSENATPIYTLTRPQNQYNAANVKEQCPQCGVVGNPANPLDPANLVEEAGLTDVRDLFLNAACGGANGFSCRADRAANPDSVNFRMFASEITLDDAVDPVFAGTPTGSLVQSGATLKGPAGVSFSATDKGSGLARAVVEVDGRAVIDQPLDDNGGACRTPYTRTVPCKLSGGGSLSLDTASLPDGPHSVRLLVSDATRTNAVAFGPVDVTTRNAAAPGPGSGSPAPACVASPPFSITAKARRRTVSFGARATLAGRIRTASGAPAGGTAFGVLAGSQGVAGGTARASGAYRVRVPAGANRTLRVSVAVPGGLACSAPIGLRVRAGATLSARPRSLRVGRSARFTGRVRGGPIPRGGKLVVLQARDNDGRWRPVRNLRTKGDGRFSARYRFRSSRGRFTYRFRVQVPRERRFPYVLGYSSAREVTVRGR